MSANSTTSARSVLYHIRDKGKTKQKHLKNRSYLDIIVIMGTESSECQNIEFSSEELQVIEQVQEIVNSSDRFEEDKRPDVLEVVKHSRCMADQWKNERANPEMPQKTNNLYYRLQVLLGDLQVDPGLLERYMSDLESIEDKWDTFVQANKNKIDELFELIHTEGSYNEALKEIALSIIRVRV